jgi:hypothetical protein
VQKDQKPEQIELLQLLIQQVKIKRFSRNIFNPLKIK